MAEMEPQFNLKRKIGSESDSDDVTSGKVLAMYHEKEQIAPKRPRLSASSSISDAPSDDALVVPESVVFDEDVGYEYLDHPADIQLHSWGKTLAQALEKLVESMYHYMLDDVKEVEEAYSYYFTAKGTDLNSMIFNVLNEPLIAFQSEPFFIGRTVNVENVDLENFEVTFSAAGDSFDLKKHKQGTDVKAITYSQMQSHISDNRTDIYVIIDI